MTKLTRTDIIAHLVSEARSAEDSYFCVCEAIALLFPKELVEQLEQLVNGPVWDGDVISKDYRSVLFGMGLATRVCSNGEQGYTGAPYIAYTILRSIKKASA